jgi:hypothetical protein
MRSLSELTQLTDLCLKVVNGNTVQSLFTLTALQELRCLDVNYGAVTIPDDLEEVDPYLHSGVSACHSVHHLGLNASSCYQLDRQQAGARRRNWHNFVCHSA